MGRQRNRQSGSSDPQDHTGRQNVNPTDSQRDRQIIIQKNGQAGYQAEGQGERHKQQRAAKNTGRIHAENRQEYNRITKQFIRHREPNIEPNIEPNGRQPFAIGFVTWDVASKFISIDLSGKVYISARC